MDYRMTQDRENAADRAKARFRRDLTDAMRSRDLLRVRTLRALIAAFDNAEAVPIGEKHERYVVHAFGDKAVEVPPLTLSEEGVRTILMREISERRSAAEQITSIDRSRPTDDLFAEAAIIEVYLPEV